MYNIPKIIIKTNGLRALFLGASCAYAVDNKYYIHLPVVMCFPIVYGGTVLYQNRERIINTMKSKEKI
jgi:hypothetical protein